ncbi:CDGSH iron-sulfur domain-containing protein [Candidatus Bathyarchaeota archaeon]|nr:CDGSH iron-sulfur domain-containing protein [Candidatus Bathyarchaeota archaeon]
MTDKNSKNAKIKVSNDGPYIISGGIPLSEKTIIADKEGTATEWCASKEYPDRNVFALCRCGQSGNKPFCDGSHLRVGFDGKEKESPRAYFETAISIDGPGLRLTDAEDLCASARFCHRGGGIWNLIEKTDMPENQKIVVEEAADCPSGRLIVWTKKSNQQIEPEFEYSIVLVNDPQAGVLGPIWVRGGVPVESSEGKIYEIRNRVTLCRCGKSQNKPFCDSSHFPEHKEWEKRLNEQ